MAFLDDNIRRAQGAVEQKFLFRKIGLPFDYASSPDDFPSRAFAGAKEARSNLPNPSGLGAGYHFSCRNHSLLFDSYLLRIELGIESPGDEAILDRLIGGLIRLDTVAPKAFLVGGLAPDGRGFYPGTSRENHAAWAYAVTRGLSTAAIAQESQEKFRSIAGKWIDRFRQDKYRLTTIDGKPVAGGDLSRPDAASGPFLLAMLLAAARASGEGKDYELYMVAAEEGARARLGSMEPSESPEESHARLWRQVALSIVRDRDPEPERVGLARLRLRENAFAAARDIASWRGWDASLAGTPVDFNWRSFPKVPLHESPYGFTPPESWARVRREELLETSLLAMYTMMLAGDRELLEPLASEMEECLGTVPWDRMVTLNAVAPAIGVHALGVETGLWDKDLYGSRREGPSSEVSFAARYLEPDYDKDNPEKAGHSAVPPGKRKAEEAQARQDGGSGKRRRRRRWR